MLIMYSHNNQSKGAQALCKNLGIKRIRHRESKFLGGLGWAVLNWGSSQVPVFNRGTVIINKSNSVSIASNKLNFFTYVSEFFDDMIPPHTTDREQAREWAESGRVVCRTILSGSGGKGITIASNPDQVIDAKLYTKYIPKKEEFRIHIFEDEVIHVQRKARVRNIPNEDVNWAVRNLEGGFIYAKENVKLPDCCQTLALDAMKLCNLDFGAVDVIYNEGQDRACVLEINTAPGLMGTTVDKYTEAFRKFVN